MKEAPFAYEVKVAVTLDESQGIHLVAYQPKEAHFLNLGVYFSESGLVFGTSVGLPVSEKPLQMKRAPLSTSSSGRERQIWAIETGAFLTIAFAEREHNFWNLEVDPHIIQFPDKTISDFEWLSEDHLLISTASSAPAFGEGPQTGGKLTIYSLSLRKDIASFNLRIMKFREVKEERNEIDIVYKDGKRLVRDVTQKFYIVNEAEDVPIRAAFN